MAPWFTACCVLDVWLDFPGLVYFPWFDNDSHLFQVYFTGWFVELVLKTWSVETWRRWQWPFRILDGGYNEIVFLVISRDRTCWAAGFWTHFVCFFFVIEDQLLLVWKDWQLLEHIWNISNNLILFTKVFYLRILSRHVKSSCGSVMIAGKMLIPGLPYLHSFFQAGLSLWISPKIFFLLYHQHL